MGDAAAPSARFVIVVLGLLMGTGTRAGAQAFTPEKGLFSVTALYQFVQNSGHRMSDGFMFRVGQSISTGAQVEGEYGVNDRFAVTLALPYILVKYTGDTPTPANLPVDSCHCWHSGLADFTGSARYHFGTNFRALTPTVGFTLPSHAYNYKGEAVLGRRLKELRLGASLASRPAFLPQFVISAGYSYAIVEKSKVDVPNNRSNASFDIGRTIGERVSVHANAAWQRTHGGLRFGSVSPTTTLPFPGEVGLNGRLEGPKFEEHDRLLRDNHWRIGGAVSYSLEKVDVFAAVSAYVSGTDAHDGESFTLGATWYFGGPPKVR